MNVNVQYWRVVGRVKVSRSADLLRVVSIRLIR